LNARSYRLEAAMLNTPLSAVYRKKGEAFEVQKNLESFIEKDSLIGQNFWASFL
jgi:hypothetical protein